MSVKIIVIESDDMRSALAALRAAFGEAVTGEPAPAHPSATDLPPTAAAIMEEVCRSFELQRHQIAGPARDSSIALARQVFYHLCREWTGLSLAQIGKLLARHHTSVLSGVAQVKQRILDDTHFANVVAGIEDALAKRGINPFTTENTEPTEKSPEAAP